MVAQRGVGALVPVPRLRLKTHIILPKRNDCASPHNCPLDFRDGSMLLKKSFWGYQQIFTEALVGRSENDVGGHMISPISNRQPS